MNPALLLATSTVGLIPLLLRGDLPPTMRPFELLLDAALRLVALIFGLMLVTWVLTQELTDAPWRDPEVHAAIALGAWTLLALAAEYALIARHRLWLALEGDDGRRPHLRAPGATNWIYSLSLALVAIWGLSLSTLATSGVAGVNVEATTKTIMWGAVTTGTFLLIVVSLALALYARIAQRLPTATATARALAGRTGAWVEVDVEAPACADSSGTFWVWNEAGRWYWTSAEAGRLLRFRRQCAAIAERPCEGLHVKRLTLSMTPGRRPKIWRSYGFRVWDPNEYRWLGAWGAHYAEAFDVDEMGSLPHEARGLLVPLNAAALTEAGLAAKVQ
ncbi:MAG: hypothetical protein PGN13_13470 [Patulibacter minatonensis]